MKTNLKKRMVAGLFIPILLQLVVLLILVPPINGMQNNADQLSIAVVTNGSPIGEQAAKQLKNALPFQVKTVADEKKAVSEMNNGDWQMVMAFPKDFDQTLQSGNAEIHFSINQAVPPTVKSIMTQAAGQITDTLNSQIYQMAQQKMTTHLPANAAQMLSHLSAHMVQAKITKIHNVDGELSSVLPFVIFLTTFIGIMIMMLIHYRTLEEAAFVSRWKAFLFHQVANALAALIFPVGLWIILASYNVHLSVSVGTLWMFLSLAFFTFALFVQMFVYFFRLPGIGVAALFLLAQVIACGIILPTALVPAFYRGLAPWLPATYYGDGIYTILFGGSALSSASASLAWTSVICLAIAAIAVWIRKQEN